MKAFIVGLIALLFVGIAVAATITNPYTITVTTTSSGVTFTPLHLYYLSSTGSDSNNGLSPSSPWLTAHHNLQCGDVVIAAAGTYTNNFSSQSFGTVANCPSTSAGIDGTGGINFATILCAGPDLEACKVNGVF